MGMEYLYKKAMFDVFLVYAGKMEYLLFVVLGINA